MIRAVCLGKESVIADRHDRLHARARRRPQPTSGYSKLLLGRTSAADIRQTEAVNIPLSTKVERRH